jgi:hypothetical protein
MSAAQIIAELPKLTPSELEAVRRKLAEICVDTSPLVLQDRGIDQARAADLRARLKAFVEDWERPEDSIYDETAPR